MLVTGERKYMLLQSGKAKERILIMKQQAHARSLMHIKSHTTRLDIDEDNWEFGNWFISSSTSSKTRRLWPFHIFTLSLAIVYPIKIERQSHLRNKKSEA